MTAPNPPGTDLGGLHADVLYWYDTHARSLPWREPGCSPWGVLVSEVMLQQTPVARVEPVWRQWMRRWPEPADLAADAAGEAIRAWDRLGYPRRALRLHAAATAIRDRHDGRVPEALAELLDLPGVGSYTAAAVASFAFGQRHAVVDTNVRRVHARAITGVAEPAPALTADETRLAVTLLPTNPAVAARWGVAVMELGALVCTARSPECGRCPIRGRCVWQREGRPVATGPRRRTQAWHGTDRQLRGRLLAVLRDHDDAVPRQVLFDACVVEDEALAQRDRCLAGLVDDGLVVRSGDDYGLPR